MLNIFVLKFLVCVEVFVLIFLCGEILCCALNFFCVEIFLTGWKKWWGKNGGKTTTNQESPTHRSMEGRNKQARPTCFRCVPILASWFEGMLVQSIESDY